MAWPAEAGSLGLTQAARKAAPPTVRPRSRLFLTPSPRHPVAPIRAARRPVDEHRAPRSRLFADAALRGKHHLDGRGRYRIFNAACYRFYRSNTPPPQEATREGKRMFLGDTWAAYTFASMTWRGRRPDGPFDTNATLPHTPAATYGDGTWYLACSYFNGVIDSGFLPIGPGGETYLRLDISGGQATDGPPRGPNDFRIEQAAGGVVRVIAFYVEIGDLRADEWAIAYTIDDSPPPEDTPDITQVMDSSGLCVLDYDLPAQAHGVTVKCRLQTRRLDGAVWVYSENSTVLTITADAVGPTAPETLSPWPGQLPEDLQ